MEVDGGDPGLGTANAVPLSVLGRVDLLGWGIFETGFGLEIAPVATPCEPPLPTDSSLLTLSARLRDLNALGGAPPCPTFEFFLLRVPGVGIPVFLGVWLGLEPPAKPDPPLVEVSGAEAELGGKDTTPTRGLSFPPAATTRGRVSG